MNMNMNMKQLGKCALVATLLVMCAPTSALLTIEVTRGMASGIPIAIVPFEYKGVKLKRENRPADIIAADLMRSGRFDAVSRKDFIGKPHELKDVRYENWRLLKTEVLVIGQVEKIAGDLFEVRFRLIDVFREKQLAGQKFVVPAVHLRKIAHQISDIVYQKMIGRPGAFDTRLAYVTVHGKPPGKKFLLQVADSDGHNPKTILESKQPIMSPSWSPDGNELTYVSFEKRRSMVFVQNLWSGKRQRVADYRGINSAPAWSPDGQKLALTLSKEGNCEIYIYTLASGELRRLTRHTAIDTEPAWSPDGKSIVFTSGRAGTPQIYRIAVSGGTPERLTFSGKYNANADYSSDGKSLVMITNQGNGYRVGVYSPNDKSVNELTETVQDESPTFSPNGEMIMYATQSGGKNVLAAVSLDGRVQQVIRLKNDTVREPAWSPFNRKL